MPTPNKVERLEPEVRDLIGRLKERGRTLDEIMEALRPLDVDVSRSGLHRYLRSQAAMGERLRRVKAAAEVLSRGGDDMASTRISAALTAQIEADLFDYLERRVVAAEEAPEDGAEGAQPEDPTEALHRAAAINERLARTRRHNLQFIADAEKRGAERAKKAAAETAAQAIQQRGGSKETAEFIKAQILGIPTTPPAPGGAA